MDNKKESALNDDALNDVSGGGILDNLFGYTEQPTPAATVYHCLRSPTGETVY